MAYQYGLYERKEVIVEFDEELYFSLGFGNLLPFLKDTDGRILQAVKGDYPIQWACYYDSRQAVKGDMRTYFEKISDYYDKFSYLFRHCHIIKLVFPKTTVIIIYFKFEPAL